jgi:transposase
MFDTSLPEKPQVRTTEPVRTDGIMRFEYTEELIPYDHAARAIWEILGVLDIAPFTANSKAYEGHAGRPAHSTRMLLTLWLYGVSQGFASARRIAKLTLSDPAFRWIVGDVNVSHHILSQFRAQEGPALDGLMSNVLSVLMSKGLISLERVAQDGTRVRASAGAPSFRSERALGECLEQATLHVKAVLAEAGDPDVTLREQAARTAAALDYKKRVEAALGVMAELKEQAKPKEKPRVSTTDAEARVMKMADGGFRPAYNIQLGVAGSELGGPRTIVGVLVTNVGSDMSSVTPMLSDIKERTGQLPEKLLADGNHAKHSCIEHATKEGVEVFIAVSDREKASKSPVSPEVAAWKERMETPRAKQIYRSRAGLCELGNAQTKGAGLVELLVKGAMKVKNTALIAAISHNIVHHLGGLQG